MYLKLVVEEYIVHITPYGIDPRVELGEWMWHVPWYKRNWMSAEFALLYRWHSVIPNCMKWGEKSPTTLEYLFDNTLLLTEDGMNGDLRKIFYNISNHRATAMQLHNTESWMVGRDKATLSQSRECNLQPFAKYCKYLGIDVPTKWSGITKDKQIQAELTDVYGTVDKIEFWTGLIAMDHKHEAIMSECMTTFVANDAFNQALVHPLLSENVWKKGEESFSKVGFKIVQEKTSIAEMLRKNIKGRIALDSYVGMPRPRRGHTIPLSIYTKIILFVVVVAVAVGIWNAV